MTSAPAGDIAVGTVLDRYEIVRHVARGGMGSVWLARFAGKHGFERRVAIKTIAPEHAETKRYRDMFLDEARISARLVHANVAQVLDVGEYASGVYIVFEWVEGRSLEQICRDHGDRGEPVPLAFALATVADVCAGLHAAHELTDDEGRSLQVVHRDVTPGNVLVSDNGFAKLIDFGVAKAKGRIAGETRSGLVRGTPQYMSPEQACGMPVDRRADVWSVGAVLHRTLAGGPPFRQIEELQAFLDGRSPLPPLPEHVPTEVRAIVTRAMTLDPRGRFETAEAMRLAVERALHGGALADAADNREAARPAPPPPATQLEATAIEGASARPPAVTPAAREKRATRPRAREATHWYAVFGRTRAQKDDALRPFLIALAVAAVIAGGAIVLALCSPA
jgi:serine/threonine-protein kinase